jgi:predicted transporter
VNDKKKNFWFGIAMIVLALMILTMFGLEIYQGKLEGSRSYGLTREATPLVFYLSTGLEFILSLLLITGGIYTLRQGLKK